MGRGWCDGEGVGVMGRGWCDENKPRTIEGQTRSTGLGHTLQ